MEKQKVKAKKIIKILFLTPLIILFVLFEIFVVCLYSFHLYIGDNLQTQTTKSIPTKEQNK